MGTRVVDIIERSIDYRLNLLGVRVWETHCQLISRRGSTWFPIGPVQNLPIRLPGKMAELKEMLADEIYVTATQFHIEHSESDIAAVLGKRKDFEAALAERSAKAI